MNSNNNNRGAECNYVVTIGREFGCGAREIGKKVAERLGIPYYDKELLTEAAKSSGVRSDVFEQADERTPNFLTNLFAFNIGYSGNALYVGNGPQAQNSVYAAQSEVIKDLARKSSCVIVGRTADYILRDVANVISIFIHDSLDNRVERMIARGDCNSREEAVKMTQKKNQQRADYYNFYTGKRWRDASSYNLCVDVSQLGVEAAAELIIHYVRVRIGLER